MLKILIERLENADAPIILIWAWANRKRITKYLTKFIEEYNIPFFTSQMWKWVVDESKSQYLGTAALTQNDYIHSALEKSDLILSVWYDSIEKPTQVITEWKTQIIHINFTSTNMDSVYSPSLEVIWDIWNLFWQLTENKINSSKWNFSEIYKINEENKIKIENNLKLEENSNIIWPRKLANILRENLEKKDILALDNGLYKVWLARNYPAYEPNTILLDNALATMWAWFSSAMEAKKINPENKVVCVTGDWWLVMNLWDLETAIRLKLDLVVIVLNNSNYWMIKWKQKNAWFDDFWLDFLNPDFTKLIESFWWTGFKVENKNDFDTTLKKALNTKWLVLIDLIFEYPNDIK
jgi:acetolactate synthase-1/2/3 large subunit